MGRQSVRLGPQPLSITGALGISPGVVQPGAIDRPRPPFTVPFDVTPYVHRPLLLPRTVGVARLFSVQIRYPTDPIWMWTKAPLHPPCHCLPHISTRPPSPRYPR